MLTDSELRTPPPWAKKDVEWMYLFGSRSMALRKGYKDVLGEEFDTDLIRERLTEKTDFDFAAPYSEELVKKLTGNGWLHIGIDGGGVYHPCKLLKAILMKEQDGQSVQILLRSNHELFTKMWDSLDPGFWYHYIWKSSPEFAFKNFEKKYQKKMITEILDQSYNVINRQYGFYK